jgi:phosphoglycerate dehydrogenase-like enzyme
MSHDAAARALESGKVAGLGTDVAWVEPVPTDDPPVRHPRVIMTPHIAGVTELACEHVATVVVQRCRHLRRGGVPASCVNVKAVRGSCNLYEGSVVRRLCQSIGS